MKKLYENGQLKSEGNYKDYNADGKWTMWHENGLKKEEGNYKDGYRDGKWTEWYENGQKQEESFWKDGFLVGESTCWDKAGRKTIIDRDLPFFVALFLSFLLTYLIIDRYNILLVAGLIFLLVIMLLLKIVVDRLNHYDKSIGDYAVAFTVIFIYAFVTSYLIQL